MIDHAPLRLSAVLLLVGQLLYIVITQFHTGGEANNHPLTFGRYAGSGDWTGVHVGQFAAMAVIIAGLVVLYFVLDVRTGAAAWLARLGAASAVVALYAALQAVDGVGNKQADAAWVNAPSAQKAARFASAEAMRWLEWGMRSYHDYALGLALLLFAAAAAAVRSVRIPGMVAYLMGLSGITYLVQGWVVGSQGFSGRDTYMILLAWALSLISMIWLVIVARPAQTSEAPSVAG